jgi:hypothetical protein
MNFVAENPIHAKAVPPGQDLFGKSFNLRYNPALRRSAMTTPSLSLKDLFRLAFSGHVVWLSGDPEARPNVTWVQPMS